MKNLRNPNDTRIVKTYEQRYDSVLKKLSTNLSAMLQDLLKDTRHVDRISTRAKDPKKFNDKSLKKDNSDSLKYVNPLDEIQDQIGARIVVFYLDDVNLVSEIITDIFRKIEEKHLIPENEYEFGYVGKHFVLFVPEDVKEDDWQDEDIPTFFELQIKTLYQHAWSEANHDLAYKAAGELNSKQKREFAFTAAQSWGADEIFSRLYQSLESKETKDSNS